MERIGERDAILLLVEESVEEDARARRDEAFLPVPDVPDRHIIGHLRTALFGPGDVDGPDVARYGRVCIVAFPSSPVRRWVTAFFAAEVPWLVEAGGLCWCLPPFDRRHMTPVDVAGALGLADQWPRLPPEPAAATSAGPKLHPSWLDRPGVSGWWSGPEVVVAAGDPMVHLRVQEGRRSFCGRRARELDVLEPAVDIEQIPRDRRCDECARLWWEDLRPEREWERRGVLRRIEATEALLGSFDQLDAINRTIADAPDWPSAHAALTAEPFGYTDLQAFHILSFPAGRRTTQARADLEAEHDDLRSRLADLDAFLAQDPNPGQTTDPTRRVGCHRP